MAVFKRIVLPTAEDLARLRAKEEREARERQEAVLAREREAIEAKRRAQKEREALSKLTDKQRQGAAPKADFIELFATSDGDAGRRGEHKRWAAWTAGTTLVTECGRVGAAQQCNNKSFSTVFGAREALSGLIKSKRLKGYRDRI